MMGKAIEGGNEGKDGKANYEETKKTFGYVVVVLIALGLVASIFMNSVAYAISEAFMLVIAVLVYWWVLGKHQEHLDSNKIILFI